MSLKVIITGTTGMVGRGVLLECLESNKIGSIMIPNRRSINLTHPKLEEIIVEDFFNLEALRGRLSDVDACMFCLGISSFKQSEEAYTKITYELTMKFAALMLEENPNATFCYVSGAGTDSSEKSRSMWSRVKGKTENDLLKFGFKSAFMFRPGYIQPMKGIKSRTPMYNNLYKVFSPLYAILKRFPASATNTTNLGLAMISVVVNGYEKSILGNKEINEIAKASK